MRSGYCIFHLLGSAHEAKKNTIYYCMFVFHIIGFETEQVKYNPFGMKAILFSTILCLSISHRLICRYFHANLDGKSRRKFILLPSLNRVAYFFFVKFILTFYNFYTINTDLLLILMLTLNCFKITHYYDE